MKGDGYMEKVIILGTGPAGLTAALYTARANLEPLVIEGLEPGGQLTTTTEVENYPGFVDGIMGPELMDVMRRQAARFGARYQTGLVESVVWAPGAHQIRLDSGDTLTAATVIICTGASAKYMGLESERTLIGRGVTSCATCDGAFYRNRPIAVVGGGDSAMEEALFLTRFTSDITLIHRRDQFRASKIMADRVMHHDKIKIRWDTVVDEVLDVAKGEVTGLRLRNVKTDEVDEIAIDGLFIAIGHRPNTAPFADTLATDPAGYIKTVNTRTDVEGVFAAGDVQDSVYRQAITAAGSGCMAALEAERYLEAHGQ
jgi:thioredoxin reductase (NADPH)